jgi:hypothetical protein
MFNSVCKGIHKTNLLKWLLSLVAAGFCLFLLVLHLYLMAFISEFAVFTVETCRKYVEIGKNDQGIKS